MTFREIDLAIKAHEEEFDRWHDLAAWHAANTINVHRKHAISADKLRGKVRGKPAPEQEKKPKSAKDVYARANRIQSEKNHKAFWQGKDKPTKQLVELIKSYQKEAEEREQEEEA